MPQEGARHEERGMHCRRVPACHLRKTRGSQSSASCGMHRPVPPQLYHSWSALSRNMKPRKVVTCTCARVFRVLKSLGLDTVPALQEHEAAEGGHLHAGTLVYQIQRQPWSLWHPPVTWCTPQGLKGSLMMGLLRRCPKPRAAHDEAVHSASRRMREPCCPPLCQGACEGPGPEQVGGVTSAWRMPLRKRCSVAGSRRPSSSSSSPVSVVWNTPICTQRTTAAWVTSRPRCDAVTACCPHIFSGCMHALLAGTMHPPGMQPTRVQAEYLLLLL